MIFQVCAVFDSKAGVHCAPFFQPTLGMALRAFSDAANILDHPLSKNAEDYTLFHLGTFDDATAVFTTFPKHVSLGLASMYKKEVTSV